MEYEKIVKISDFLYEEAFLASAYWYLINDFQENCSTYNDIMNLSPGFYRISLSAWIDGLIMALSRLYIPQKDSYSIDTLFDNIEEFEEYFYDENTHLKFETYNRKYSSDDESFYPDNATQTGGYINLSFAQYIEYFKSKYNSLKNYKEIIKNHRNKRYAHIDKDIVSHPDTINNNYPLNEVVITSLIDFALDFIGFCIEGLIGKSNVRGAVVDDWKRTLELIRSGNLYDVLDAINDITIIPAG